MHAQLCGDKGEVARHTKTNSEGGEQLCSNSRRGECGLQLFYWVNDTGGVDLGRECMEAVKDYFYFICYFYLLFVF